MTERAKDNDYEKITENLVTHEKERERKKLDDGLEMKYSVM